MASKYSDAAPKIDRRFHDSKPRLTPTLEYQQMNLPTFDQPDQLMRAIDDQISHIWMVRTFLKHSDEAAEDEELASVHRDLYDYMLALGPSLDAGDAERYVKLAKKKIGKLRKATELYFEIQPEISGHMNFRMAAESLKLAVGKINELLENKRVTK